MRTSLGCAKSSMSMLSLASISCGFVCGGLIVVCLGIGTDCFALRFAVLSLHRLFPPTLLLGNCKAKGLPRVVALSFQLANLLNQHIDLTVSRQYKGVLLFLVTSNLLWCIIQMLSSSAKDKELKVRFYVGWVGEWVSGWVAFLVSVG
jgi:hypothetical protein